MVDVDIKRGQGNLIQRASAECKRAASECVPYLQSRTCFQPLSLVHLPSLGKVFACWLSHVHCVYIVSKLVFRALLPSNRHSLAKADKNYVYLCLAYIYVLRIISAYYNNFSKPFVLFTVCLTSSSPSVFSPPSSLSISCCSNIGAS